MEDISVQMQSLEDGPSMSAPSTFHACLQVLPGLEAVVVADSRSLKPGDRVHMTSFCAS